MAHNRYYMVNSTDPNLDTIYSYTVGDGIKQRCSIDESLIVVKLFEGDHEEHPELSQYTEYSHEQILPFMNSPAWQPEII